MNYRHTLNVTLSDKDPGAMPQRGNLPTREVEIQAYWDRIDLYALSLAGEAPRGTFILHDGPPYSNGGVHLGTALNKIAKDIIVKYKTMQGYRAPYVPGWDNHGMPIENNVSREFREAGIKPDTMAMRRRCREYAAEWVEVQKAQFKRLGVRGDWGHPYLTMNHAIEAKIVEVFGDLAEKGYIYRGLKPVLWCPICATALADAEVEYADHTSPSITVRFPVVEDPQRVFGLTEESPANAYALIWTTTPWTIPANLAVAVHPDAEYVVAEAGGARYLVAEPLLAATMAAVAPGLDVRTVGRVRGSELEGVVARHPLFERPSPLVMASYVTMEDGTGLVHTAPGHGKEDFETGQRYGLEALCPVDAHGVFTQHAGAQFAGVAIPGGEGDRRIIAALEQTGALMARSDVLHSYPHCWRCKSPLMFRATVQWFMNIDHEGHRERCLDEIAKTRWYPPVSINRIHSMVSSRPDWCLSRQRAWGVGIPAFYCRSCGHEILDPVAIRAVRDIVAKEGSDAWYAHPAEEILPAGFHCSQCGGSGFDKETDHLDVWFDSGSTHLAVLESDEWPELSWPADLYIEGSDQHRGWFNSSLMVSVGTAGQAPYRSVVTVGWTLDEEGKAMHKSAGNAVAPEEATEKYGADILRLWVASTDYFEDVRCSDHILQQVAESYRRFRNTFRFLVNNLYDFDPEKHAVPYEQMLDLDRWALAELDRVVAASAAGYDDYEFHRVFHAVHNFCAVELSAFYLDVLKDRLYCSPAASVQRRSAQTAMHTIAETLARIMAPILSHTAEEVWSHLRMPDRAQSPQLAPFPAPEPAQHAAALARWAPVLAAREWINVAIEEARRQNAIGNPLEAQVELAVDQATHDALAACVEFLPAALKVSVVTLGVSADGSLSARVRPAAGAKCARCWLVREEVGSRADAPDLCDRCAEAVGDCREESRAS